MMRFVRAVALVSLLGSLGFVLVPANADHGFAAPYTVTAALSKSRVDLGGGATLSGSVSPTAAGHTVAIKVLQPGGSTWSTLKTVLLDAHSEYSTVVRPTRAGVTWYRVVRATVGGHRGASSPTRTLTAWRRRSLAGMPAGSGSTGTITSVASVTLQGQTFKPGLIQTPGNAIDFGDRYYDLSGRCSKLDAWVSVTSDSADDDQIAAWFLGDTLVNPHSYTNLLAHNVVHRDGDPVHIVRSGSSVSAIGSLDVYIQSVNTGDKVGWGSPRLYCKF